MWRGAEERGAAIPPCGEQPEKMVVQRSFQRDWEQGPFFGAIAGACGACETLRYVA